MRSSPPPRSIVRIASSSRRRTAPTGARASARHALRIRVKRLRYSCEFFAPAFPARRVTPYITALKTLQDILGELNDIAVGRRLLGVAGDEAALLRRLAPAWRALERRPVFWRARA